MVRMVDSRVGVISDVALMPPEFHDDPPEAAALIVRRRNDCDTEVREASGTSLQGGALLIG